MRLRFESDRDYPEIFCGHFEFPYRSDEIDYNANCEIYLAIAKSVRRTTGVGNGGRR